MKTIFSTILAVFVALTCFGSGTIPVNSTQTGTITITNGQVQGQTNQFASAFSYPPVMQFFLVAGNTNALPLTNLFTTTTNFALTYCNGTNATVAWSATAANFQLQFGSVTNVATSPTNITFPTPFAYPPSVVAVGGGTNVGPVAVTGVTTTNFTLTANLSQTNYWQAVGPTLNPGPQAVSH